MPPKLGRSSHLVRFTGPKRRTDCALVRQHECHKLKVATHYYYLSYDYDFVKLRPTRLFSVHSVQFRRSPISHSF